MYHAQAGRVEEPELTLARVQGGDAAIGVTDTDRGWGKVCNDSMHLQRFVRRLFHQSEIHVLAVVA